MFVVFSINAEGSDQHQLPMCNPSIWMTRRSSLDRSDAIRSASRSADSATNRREAADFEVAIPGNDRQIALGPARHA